MKQNKQEQWEKELNAILISGKQDVDEPIGDFYKRIKDLFKKTLSQSRQEAVEEERERIRRCTYPVIDLDKKFHKDCPTSYIQEVTDVPDKNNNFNARFICPEHGVWWEEVFAKSLSSRKEE
jgi:hypothetical protein